MRLKSPRTPSPERRSYLRRDCGKYRCDSFRSGRSDLVSGSPERRPLVASSLILTVISVSLVERAEPAKSVLPQPAGMDQLPASFEWENACYVPNDLFEISNEPLFIPIGIAKAFSISVLGILVYAVFYGTAALYKDRLMNSRRFHWIGRLVVDLSALRRRLFEVKHSERIKNLYQSYFASDYPNHRR